MLLVYESEVGEGKEVSQSPIKEKVTYLHRDQLPLNQYETNQGSATSLTIETWANPYPFVII